MPRCLPRYQPGRSHYNVTFAPVFAVDGSFEKTFRGVLDVKILSTLAIDLPGRGARAG